MFLVGLIFVLGSIFILGAATMVGIVTFGICLKTIGAVGLFVILVMILTGWLIKIWNEEKTEDFEDTK